MDDYVKLGIIFVILAFVFLMTYRKTKLKYKLLSIYLLILFMDLMVSMMIPSPYEWITFLIFIILMFLILFNKFTLDIINNNVDQIYADKEPQIWDDFDIPPELNVQNNGK